MRYLFDKNLEHSSCGVGFLTNKHSKQTHELLELSHQALCKIPHRGGMSSEGIGDGAGVNIDISVNFYRHLTQNAELEYGEFGVANFFYPRDKSQHGAAEAIIKEALDQHKLPVLLWREVEVNPDALNAASRKAQLSIKQVVFARPDSITNQADFEAHINEALLEIEKPAFNNKALKGFYPLSMSSFTQVYKGRLNSGQVIPYFKDLSHPEHCIHTLFFHTRFSTNTAPNPMFAQPFRRMAHNGELNTDKKNRLSEDAIARSHNKEVIFPEGQSDSARLDQTLARRITEDKLDIVKAVLAMMPPAWENDSSLSPDVIAMLEYFSLYEEKNDGPAALIFFDGVKVGARLDRLGLRPLRSVETNDYIAVMSEAGQIDFPASDIIRRGRIEAGGMLVFDHSTSEVYQSNDVLEKLAAEQNYQALLEEARFSLSDLPEKTVDEVTTASKMNISARHVAYSMNQESFKFMLDPMLQSGMEKISAMGYGLAPNALTADEGGMSRYFSQRFAQVTNPPLDSIREVDGMTLRVALGGKPNFSPKVGKDGSQQLVIKSPILQPQQLLQIRSQQKLRVETVDILYISDANNTAKNEAQLNDAIERVCQQVEDLARERCDIIVLSDDNISTEQAAIPAILIVSAVNQRLIKQGLRFNCSVVMETGQASNTHDVACILGFGASAVCPLTVYHRSLEVCANNDDVQKALNNFQKAVEKALMKTMGKFGLCTAESYIGGEFFEASFIDTNEPALARFFPNIHSPIGGAQFTDIAASAANWHKQATKINDESEIPLLGLFKERSEGAGHSFGSMAVREFVNMTEEPLTFVKPDSVGANAENINILPEDTSYLDESYDARTPEEIDNFKVTKAYRDFIENLHTERKQRPAALRDIMELPYSLNAAESENDFSAWLNYYNMAGNIHYSVQGLRIENPASNTWQLALNNGTEKKHAALAKAIDAKISVATTSSKQHVEIKAGKEKNAASQFFSKLTATPDAIDINKVQAAHEITPALASGAMSHGALVEVAHEAVAQGINMAGGMSNCGEGGENSRRYNSVKASKIKQFASGRFGVWTGYLADPCLKEIEIKIAQGAKPGEGGQLPAKKVDVVIAAARGGTPGVELVSPPPHHDTYSIEDLGQLIHDAKAARVRVIVKLVSSEGIGTIAVGVAKAGADVINVAGNTGGTGAAQVTSLKNSGRTADIGIAEVHQALAENGLRDKVILRCSNAHQTGLDVVKSAILGGDSFEFGTTALMMLKCVMAKNCNVKCPAGLTTNPEVYAGDPRALTQYFINLAHEVREILASIGYTSLREIRGQTQLLNLVEHPAIVGKLDMAGLLHKVDEVSVDKPVYLEADFTADDTFIDEFKKEFIDNKATQVTINGSVLNNRNKTTGGQFAIDIERLLNYELSATDVANHSSIYTLENGRVVLADNSVTVVTENSAGQSFGAFSNTGINLRHKGTCNDGVGKGLTGGRIIVENPGFSKSADKNIPNRNVLVGNFALFGATGGKLFVNGQAGDRFGVRNSGAVAVVEGIGEFGCEYMTNGCIVNIGSYGSGFGNGMSGGSAFQYDPSGQLAERCSQDSVAVFPINDGSSLAAGHETALRLLLEEHIELVDSSLAKKLLDNWEESSQHFYYVIPRSLLNYHRSENIAKAHDRKAMLEELASSIANKQLSTVKDGYANFIFKGKAMFQGATPEYGECDSDLIYRYINTTGVMHRAHEAAQKTGEADLDATARKLIATQDRKLVEALIKDAKEALKDYDDTALACLLADKRVIDYKDSLRLREVWDIQAFASSVWIIECDRINHTELASYPSLAQQLAKQYTQLLATAMRDDIRAA